MKSAKALLVSLLVCIALAFGAWATPAFADEPSDANGSKQEGSGSATLLEPEPGQEGTNPAITPKEGENPAEAGQVAKGEVPPVAEGPASDAGVAKESQDTPDGPAGPLAGEAGVVVEPDGNGPSAIPGAAEGKVSEIKTGGTEANGPAAPAENAQKAVTGPQAPAAESAWDKLGYGLWAEYTWPDYLWPGYTWPDYPWPGDSAYSGLVAELDSGTLCIKVVQWNGYDYPDWYWIYGMPRIGISPGIHPTWGTVGYGGGTTSQSAKVYRLGDGVFTSGESTPWYESRDNIRYVTFGVGVKPVSMAYWFAGLYRLEGLDFTGLDTSGVTDMSGMFAGCNSIKSLDLSSFNTTNLKSTSGMFEGCTSLAALDVSSFSAEQLDKAAIPTDNEGGFWLMNVPQGYDTGIALREATAEERAAAGLPDPVPGDDPAPGGQDNPGDNPTPGDDPVPGGESDHNANPGQGGQSGQNAIPASYVVSQPVGDDSAVLESALANEPTSPATEVIEDLLTPLAGDVAESMFGPSPNSPIDPGAMIETAAGIVDALGVNETTNQAAAMAAAALGMVVAAGLVLALCFKIG